MKIFSLLSLSLFLALSAVGRADDSATASPYAKWTHGPSTDSHFFPIAVWLQEPKLADQFGAAGINVYLGLYKGPTDEQLAALKQANMKVICEQNDFALKHLDDPTFIGWMHGDEPDNAQSLPGHKGYGPPVPPQKIVDEYTRISQADPSRPVMLNLGQGVAFEKYNGRGVRSNHPEDYPEYIKGADIVSFDIYPVTNEHPDVAGNLWYIAKGVDNLIKAANGKPTWNCLECTHIGSTKKATPAQVRTEAWMALIHGSQGLIYFVHEFKPKEDDEALLHDPEMLAAVTALNKQIESLAPALNSPTVPNGAQVQVDDQNAPVDIMVKHLDKSIYLFAAEMRNAPAKATFTIPDATTATSVTVLGENRTIPIQNGAFTDAFAPYDVHLYQIGN